MDTNDRYGDINQVYQPILEINTPPVNLDTTNGETFYRRWYTYDVDQFTGITNYNYNQLMETRKTEEFLYNQKDKENEITKEDKQILEKIVNIQNKIKEMRSKNNLKIEDTNKKKEINKKIEELQKILLENNNKYQYYVNLHTKDLYPEHTSKLPEGIKIDSYDELKDEKIIKLKEILQYNNRKINENEKIIIETSEKINTMINIIHNKDIIEKKEDDESNVKCSICKEKDVEICINPCGHTFCDTCSPVIFTYCHICRGDVRSKIKLFFS
jgi:hypothetical protein